MTAEEHIRAQCELLLQQGSLPRSSCRAGLLAALRPLLDSGVVLEERSGAGRRLVVRDPSTARMFVARRFPGAPVFAGASSRVASVVAFRNSKTLARDEPEIVCARAWRSGVLRRDDQEVDVNQATSAHGMFSFLLDAPSPYALRGPCALVENVSVLIHFERLNLPAGMALWSRGRMSGRFLDWLAAQDAADFTLVHLPDYDPVGLGEFARLRRRLGRRVRLYLPEDLPARFDRFSNPDLLDKANNRALLANLRKTSLPEIQQVLQLIDRHNAALEQEALLIPAPS